MSITTDHYEINAIVELRRMSDPYAGNTIKKYNVTIEVPNDIEEKSLDSIVINAVSTLKLAVQNS